MGAISKSNWTTQGPLRGCKLTRTFQTKLLLSTIAGFIFLSAVGCKQQAYNELYSEQMAAEIRALEDRIYEFDSEYRALEQELLAAEEELEHLRQSEPTNSRRSFSENSSPISNAPSVEFKQPSVVPSPTPDPVPDAVKGNSNSNLAPPPVTDGSGSANSGEPPKGDAPKSTKMPEGAEALPSGKPAAIIDPELLEPPSIEFSPPSAQPKSTSKQRSPQPPVSDDEAIRLGQIYVPDMGNVQLASSQSPAKKPKPQTLDKKIVEVAFHMPLCRGHNSDEDPEDDEVYLVLQPKNAKGEFVAEAADITVVAVDPNVEGEEGKIGRWHVSRNEAANLMQPAGVSQGIHLSLPFQEKMPTGDRVIVYVRYELPNGLRAVNEHQIFISQGKRSVWSPRITRINAVDPR
jgi:hypothetical protein